MTVTVKRCDIDLYEDQFPINYGFAVNTTWTASLDSSLSTGEDVQMSRYGSTAAEALATLEAAIAEQGWEIR